jgi:hypothetical protein
MDFVTDLPESTASGYTDMVVVDRLTKVAIYLPYHKDVNSPELLRMFFEEVICKEAPRTISLSIENSIHEPVLESSVLTSEH